MKYLKLFEQFIQQIPVEQEAPPPEVDSTTNDEEIEKKKKEDEQQEIEVEPGLELKMNTLRNQHGN